MQKITILSKASYKGFPVILIQFGTTFQYLCEVAGEFYQDYFKLKPEWKGWVMWRLGLLEHPYTAEQMNEGRDILVNGAVKTINGLNTGEKKAEIRIKKKQLKEQRRKLRDSACFWQGRKNEQGEDIFYCLIHGEETPVPD